MWLQEEAWQKILLEFNSCNAVRSLSQLKSKFDNLKTATRKYAGNIKRSLYGTGRGPSTEDSKNNIFEVVLDILNKKTVEGHYNSYDDDAFANSVTEETGQDSTLCCPLYLQKIL